MPRLVPRLAGLDLLSTCASKASRVVWSLSDELVSQRWCMRDRFDDEVSIGSNAMRRACRFLDLYHDKTGGQCRVTCTNRPPPPTSSPPPRYVVLPACRHCRTLSTTAGSHVRLASGLYLLRLLRRLACSGLDPSTTSPDATIGLCFPYASAACPSLA